jgi:hypothetical protein
MNVEQISYNICSGELLLYTVWFLLELILCGTNIQSKRQVSSSLKNMEADEYEKIFSYLSDGSYIKGKDFLFIYQY